MTTPRRNYSPAFKTEIVQELLRQEQSLSQIASKHGVHPNQLERMARRGGDGHARQF